MVLIVDQAQAPFDSRQVDETGRIRQFGIIGRKRVQTSGPGAFGISGGHVVARLKAMPVRLAAVPVTVMAMTSGNYEADRAQWSQARKWYQSKRWRKDIRPGELVKAQFTCLWCRHCDPTGKTLVVDHKVPHRGDEDLFWAEGNRQVLCTTCHNGRKQRDERGGGIA